MYPAGIAAACAAPATATGSAQSPAATAAGATPPGATQAAAIPAGYIFPHEKIPDYVMPDTPLPAGLDFPANLTGDVARGKDLVTNPANLGKAPCATCHVIKDAAQLIPDDMAKGPNLTHVGSRITIGAGLYPNDDAHLARWIKNARAMKPGVTMPTLGKGQIDPITKQPVATGAGLTDQEIADIVAYLRSLR
jgi:cytochrome c oxidase subunit 2